MPPQQGAPATAILSPRLCGLSHNTATFESTMLWHTGTCTLLTKQGLGAVFPWPVTLHNLGWRDRCLFTSPQKKSHGNYQKIEMNGSTNKTLSYLAHSQKAVPFSFLQVSGILWHKGQRSVPNTIQSCHCTISPIPFQPWLLVYLLHPLPSSVGSDGKMTIILELPRKQAVHNWLGSLQQSLHTSLLETIFPFLSLWFPKSAPTPETPLTPNLLYNGSSSTKNADRKCLCKAQSPKYQKNWFASFIKSCSL